MMMHAYYFIGVFGGMALGFCFIVLLVATCRGLSIAYVFSLFLISRNFVQYSAYMILHDYKQTCLLLFAVCCVM